MFPIQTGTIASQFFRGAGPPPPPGITVDSITVNSVSSELVAAYTTDGVAENNQLPVVTGVTLTGYKNVGQTIDGSWIYFHINNALEGSTSVRLQRADDINFTINVVTLSTSVPYILVAGDEDKFIRLKILPRTADGTAGLEVNSEVYQVGSALIKKQIKISFGHAAKAFSASGWNLAHTDNPDGSYALTNLINSDGTVLTGVNIDIDLAMSDSNLGSSNAGVGDAIAFPAGSAAGFWYPASGTRGFVITLPSPLGVGVGEVTVLSNITSGTTNTATIQVGSEQQVRPNVTGSTVDDVTYFENVDFATSIAIRSIDGTGLSPINAMIIDYYITS